MSWSSSEPHVMTLSGGQGGNGTRLDSSRRSASSLMSISRSWKRVGWQSRVMLAPRSRVQEGSQDWLYWLVVSNNVEEACRSIRIVCSHVCKHNFCKRFKASSTNRFGNHCQDSIGAAGRQGRLNGEGGLNGRCIFATDLLEGRTNRSKVKLVFSIAIDLPCLPNYWHIDAGNSSTMLTLIRSGQSSTPVLRTVSARLSGGVRGVSSISEQHPERPRSGGEFKRAHAQSAGKARGSMVAERAVVPGGPTADRVA